MYRVPSIAVLFVAAAFPPSAAGQMRSMPRATGSVQANVSHFRVPPPTGRFGVMRPNSFGRRASFVPRGAFHHNLGFSIFFGNSCFTDPFFDPFFCRQFFFGNRFPFATPVFLPYPVSTTPNYEVAEQTPTTIADRESDLAREVDRLTNEVESLRAPQPAPEPVLLEWQGDRWVRVTNYGNRRLARSRITQNNRMHGPPHRRAVVQASRQDNFQPLCSPFVMDARKR